MYVGNPTNKPCRLQFNDPKVLRQINAVFIILDPKGGSRVPEGKQMLVTYLNEEPDHP